MGVVKLSTAGILDYQKYSSMLAGNTAFSPGSYDLLETQVLSSSASSVTFTGLGSYTDYKHLQIRAVLRTDRSSADDLTMIRFNGDSSSSYANHQLYGNGSTVQSSAQTSQTYIRNISSAGGTFTTNGFSAHILDILDFSSTSKNTTVRQLAGVVGNYNDVRLASGLWNSTSAVTSITLAQYITSTNFVSGTRLSLYGVKGA